MIEKPLAFGKLHHSRAIQDDGELIIVEHREQIDCAKFIGFELQRFIHGSTPLVIRAGKLTEIKAMAVAGWR